MATSGGSEANTKEKLNGETKKKEEIEIEKVTSSGAFQTFKTRK